ncbi:hypothetical protein [Deinococcus sonorensis]|uniref:Orc1-like AAA ATPase domain-containing protein n=2 Tax=Deinococcus sonorensis TaxID=309891 RepID=A0AAU7UD11_9DEIO
MAETAWLAPLAQLRAALVGQRDARGQMGSLRWLEETVQAQGGRPSTVRNILYRDVGTAADKRMLLSVLQGLSGRLNLELPWPQPPTAALPDPGDHVLDRDKRLIYRRFLQGVQRSQTQGAPPPRTVFVAGPGTGKTLLVDQLSRALPDALLLRFDDDLAPELRRLAAQLDLPAQLTTELLSRLQAGAPYAVLGAIQQQLSRALVARLDRPGAVLLVRVDSHAQLNGLPLRLPDGQTASATSWVWHHVLAPLAHSPVAVLVALSEPDGLPQRLDGYGELIVLQPPSLEDMRRFVRVKLPDLPPAEVERIVRRAGRSYDNLGLLTLLAGVGSQGQHDEPLPPLPDESLRTFLETLSVAFSSETPQVQVAFLEQLLDPERPQPLEQRRDLERAFLEPATSGSVRPTNLELIERLVQQHPAGLAERLEQRHRQAAELALSLGDPARALHHALRGCCWPLVLQTASGARAERAWQTLESAGPDVLPTEVREQLARAVVEHYAELGHYTHPHMHSALSCLERSAAVPLQVWADLKRAEGLIDAARYDEARQQLASLDVAQAQLEPGTGVDLALIEAAFARWAGDAAEAAAQVQRAQQWADEASGPLAAKVLTWQGMIAKDQGQWSEAVQALTRVAEDQRALPLQHDRAHAQLGDLWSRLGQFPRALGHLERATQGLATHGATLEELSHSRGRLGTVLRRLGELSAAQQVFAQAEAEAPDAFSRARVYSELSLLHAARGEFDRALWLGNWAWQRFREAEAQRPLEAAYRRHRLEYRVALAYLCRGLGCAYLPPLTGASTDNADLQYARQLLDTVLREMTGEGALRVDVHLALALATPDPQAAIQHAMDGVQVARHPYHRMQAHSFLTEARLRAGQHDQALIEVNLANAYARHAARLAGEHTLNDPGYAAWLIGLEAEALAPRDPQLAFQTLAQGLDEPRYHAFHAGLSRSALRVFAGSALEADVLRLVLPQGLGLLQPRDAVSSQYS